MTEEVDPEWERWVHEQCVEPMKESAVVATLYSGEVDWKIAIEMGAAVLLDKPIVLCLADESVPVPKHLDEIAYKVLVYTDPEFQKKLMRVLRRLT